MPAMNYAQVARYYDLYARSDIDVAFFTDQAQNCRSVLELTSGTGRLTIPLIEAGVNLSGLDSSPEMLAILRGKLQAKGLAASIYEMDVTSFSIPQQFDLIIFPFNSFAEIVDPAQQEAALHAIRSHLAPGGRFICTLHNPSVRLKQVNGQMYLRGRFPLPDNGGKLALYSAERYDPAAGLARGEQVYEISEPDGKLHEKFSVDLCFRIHEKDDFERLLQSAGFRIVALYGDYERGGYEAAESPFMIWVLQKSSR